MCDQLREMILLKPRAFKGRTLILLAVVRAQDCAVACHPDPSNSIVGICNVERTGRFVFTWGFASEEESSPLVCISDVGVR